MFEAADHMKIQAKKLCDFVGKLLNNREVVYVLSRSWWEVGEDRGSCFDFSCWFGMGWPCLHLQLVQYINMPVISHNMFGAFFFPTLERYKSSRIISQDVISTYCWWKDILHHAYNVSNLPNDKIHPRSLTYPWKMMVGRLPSFWDWDGSENPNLCFVHPDF